MIKVALLVEYDGSGYHGFQVQPGLRTVQRELEAAVAQVSGERVKVAAASRTDAGVHAKGQVVTFATTSTLRPQTWVSALNHYLPPQVAVKGGQWMPEDFDARRAAVRREYRYLVYNSPRPSPLEKERAHWVAQPLDMDRMNQACQALIGCHNFAAFASPGPSSPVRLVYDAGMGRCGEEVTFDMAASSFLPHQVRRTAGALVEVGRGRMEVEAFHRLVRCPQRGAAGPSLPPWGLYLTKVTYPDSLVGEWQ